MYPNRLSIPGFVQPLNPPGKARSVSNSSINGRDIISDAEVKAFMHIADGKDVEDSHIWNTTTQERIEQTLTSTVGDIFSPKHAAYSTPNLAYILNGAARKGDGNNCLNVVTKMTRTRSFGDAMIKATASNCIGKNHDKAGPNGLQSQRNIPDLAKSSPNLTRCVHHRSNGSLTDSIESSSGGSVYKLEEVSLQNTVSQGLSSDFEPFNRRSESNSSVGRKKGKRNDPKKGITRSAFSSSPESLASNSIFPGIERLVPGSVSALVSTNPTVKGPFRSAPQMPNSLDDTLTEIPLDAAPDLTKENLSPQSSNDKNCRNALDITSLSPISHHVQLSQSPELSDSSDIEDLIHTDPDFLESFPTNHLSMPSVEDGLSSGSEPPSPKPSPLPERRYRGTSSRSDYAHRYPDSDDDFRSVITPGGGSTSNDNSDGLLNPKLMRAITKDINDIKRTMAENIELPPVLRRYSSSASNNSTTSSELPQSSHRSQHLPDLPLSSVKLSSPPGLDTLAANRQSSQTHNPTSLHRQHHSFGNVGDRKPLPPNDTVDNSGLHNRQEYNRSFHLPNPPSPPHKLSVLPLNKHLGEKLVQPKEPEWTRNVDSSSGSIQESPTSDSENSPTPQRGNGWSSHKPTTNSDTLCNGKDYKDGGELPLSHNLPGQQWTFPPQNTLYSSSNSDYSTSSTPNASTRSLSPTVPENRRVNPFIRDQYRSWRKHRSDAVEKFCRTPKSRTPPGSVGHEYESDEDTDKLLTKQYTRDQDVNIPELKEQKAIHTERKKRGREVSIRHPDNPSVLIEGVLYRSNYLGSTQLLSEGKPSKVTRMMQAQEAVGRIKAPLGENQPSVAVDLFVSSEKLMVLNTNLQEILMDHPLNTISYIADIGDILVLMARRRMMPPSNTITTTADGDTVGVGAASSATNSNGFLRPGNGSGSMADKNRRQTKIICHVFESDEAQMIAQSIGQAFQVAYVEFLKANGIDDPQLFNEMDYQEVLNQQEIYAEELQLFADKDMHKEVIVPKQRGEALGVVIVESGWGSMLPTSVLANMNFTGPAARCGQLNIGNQIMAVNGHSLVGLPLNTCQQLIKACKNQTSVKLTVVSCPPVVEVLINRPDCKYQLGFSVQNGVICSLLRGGIAERGGIRVGHRIIEINGHSVVAVAHDKIVNMLATAVGEIHLRTMPTSIFRLLTGQETPHYI